MDETLGRLAQLVRARDSHLACAAAVVLAELAPRETAVVEAIAESLAKGDPVRRPFLVEALGRIGTSEAAAALAPLLCAEGPAGEEALRAVSHAGPGALRPLAELLARIPPARRAALAEALARAGQPQGFAALLAQLRGDDPNALRSVHEGLRRALPGLDAKGREALLHQLDKLLATKAGLSDEPAAVAALDLLGVLGDPAGLNLLAPHFGPRASPVLRAAALRAAARLPLDGEARAGLAAHCLPLLAETDFAGAVEPALAALRGPGGAPPSLPAVHRPALRKLLDSRFAEVREFAMQALAAEGSATGLHDLLARLDSQDVVVAETALEALAQAKGAAAPLAERLLNTGDGRTSRRLARALARRAAEIPPRLLAALARACVDLATGQAALKTPDAESAAGGAVRESDERRGALLSVLRASGAAILAEEAVKEARRLRAAGEPFRSLALLKSIIGVAGWGDEQKLELALAGLSVSGRDFSRQSRINDPHLRLLEELLSAGCKATALARRLIKDEALPRKALYYAGYHFAERMLAEREFGAALLTALAGRPRSEEGREAREKLILEGLLKVSGKARSGILEERAKALNIAVDHAAMLREEEERRAAELRAKEAAARAASRQARRAGPAVMVLESAKRKKRGR